MISKSQLIVITLLFSIVILLSCRLVFAANYVGSQACVECHQSQSNAWKGSDHDMSMRHASTSSVMGRFENTSITSGKLSGRFFMKGDQYWVNIQAPDEVDQDYQIKYTFGIEPLQQYIVEFTGGRLQLIPFAWDTRNVEQGGQRWFHLFPDQTHKHQEFYWTNTGQNWNNMCADCHSTNVKKNFNLKKNTYNTTFSEINVGCEACHGPSNDHILWAKSLDDDAENKPETGNYAIGFNRKLNKQVSHWNVIPGKSTLQPEKIIPSQQILVCAQCHSRHVQISTNDYVNSNALGDRYILNLIDSQRYYPDGQVFDENYVYGSFMQSKMARKGVVCSNCHDPHSAKLTMPKETVCLQCHQASNYATPSHHYHPSSSSGAECVNCHMPATTYMQIDSRRDHLWHIPQPEFSQKLGTPNVCLSCHKDEDNSWSSALIKSWTTAKKSTEQKAQQTNHAYFATVFASIDQGYSQAADALSGIAQNENTAAIIRASALQRMRPYPSSNSFKAIAHGLKNPDEQIRRGAIIGSENLPGRQRWQLLEPLLDDKVLAVRTQAARVLAPLWSELSKQQQSHLSLALNDYLSTLDFNSDRGSSHTSKGIIFTYQGKFAQAESAYKASIRIDPYYFPAYINLADLYRQQQKYADSVTLLQTAAQAIPRSSDIVVSLGLAYIRVGATEKAIAAFKQATQFAPENSHNHYLYGLSLESTQASKAQEAIKKAFQISRNPKHLYALCEIKIRYRDSDAKNCLATLRPLIAQQSIQKLEAQLKSSASEN